MIADEVAFVVHPEEHRLEAGIDEKVAHDEKREPDIFCFSDIEDPGGIVMIFVAHGKSDIDFFDGCIPLPDSAVTVAHGLLGVLYGGGYAFLVAGEKEPAQFLG